MRAIINIETVIDRAAATVKLSAFHFLRIIHFTVGFTYDYRDGSFSMSVRILGDAGCSETTAASGPREMQLPQAPVISIDRTRVLPLSDSQRYCNCMLL